MNKVVLTIILATPILLVGVVMWGISVLRPQMNAPPVGAGSQSTGGANAIGEWLAHGNAKGRGTESGTGVVSPESLAQGFVLIVKDEAGLAGPDSPIYIACNVNKWNPADSDWKLTQQPDGRWRIAIAQPEGGRTLQFHMTRGSTQSAERDAEGGTISTRALPMVDASKLGAGEQPRIELSVSRWADQSIQGGTGPKK